MYRRILATLDGSELAEAILPEVGRLAGATGAAVILLKVAEAPHAMAGRPRPSVVAGVPEHAVVIQRRPARTYESKQQAIDRIGDELGGYLGENAQTLRDRGIKVETRLAFGEPVEQILAVAKDEDVDLIMMATHGRTGLAQIVFGSVASRIVHSGLVPVLLVRPGRFGGHEFEGKAVE